MKLLALISLLLTSALASAQLTTEIQAKRGIFTERLYLRDKWIDGITTNLYSADSLSDNMLVTAKAISDYVRIQAGNAIPNQYAVTLPANLWMQGPAIIGAHSNYKPTLFAEQPAQMYVTQNGLRHGLSIQRSSLNQGPASIELFKNTGTGFNTLQSLQPGDSIGSIIFSGIAGNNTTVANAMSLHGRVEKTAPDYLSSGFVFNTTDSNGIFKQRMWLSGKGNLLLGDETSNEYGLNVASGDIHIGNLANSGDVLLGYDNNGVLRKLQLGPNLSFSEGGLWLNSPSDPDDGQYIFNLHRGIMLETSPGVHSEWVFEGYSYQWTRVATGVYTATINGTFAQGWTWLKSEASDEYGNAVYTRLYRSGSNTLTLIVKDANMNNTDNWSGISIEVKTYIQF
jgi:hypothetical protein